METVDRIFVNAACKRRNITWRFRRAFPAASVIEVQREAEIRQILTHPDKRSAYIGPRRSPFVSRFRCPGGVICAPFWKFTAETECLYSCHYCYLALTMRTIPYYRVASNVEDGLAELERTLSEQARRGATAMFNVGELADGRLLDPVTGFSRQLLPLIHDHPNGMLHVLSKAGTSSISNYLELSDLARGRIIHVASINPQPIIDLTEGETPRLRDRLVALRHLGEAGYRIRVRIDPIFDLRHLDGSGSDAFGVYRDMVDEVREYCAPEMVTLGSYRPSPGLIPHLRRRYPGSPVWRIETERAWPKRRLEGRETFYARIAGWVKKRFPSAVVALCKESREAWKAAGLSPAPLQCSCLPLYAERRQAQDGRKSGARTRVPRVANGISPLSRASGAVQGGSAQVLVRGHP